MRKLTLLFFASMQLFSYSANAQCTTTNATSCVCATSGSTNCDLLPDIIVGRPPLLASGSNGVIEYAQTGNGSNNGQLRVSVTTPNIGKGPLEVRTTNKYICGTDTIIGTAPASCPNTGLPPRQLVIQRVYHKTGNTMSYYDRDAGSMTYHPTHGHMHVDDWGVYTLRSSTSDPNPLNWPIIGTGAKLAFCLMDYGSCSTYNGHCVDSLGNTLVNSNFPNYGLGGGGYNCSSSVQGISSGYTDIYYQYLDGMYLNIPPGTCNGNYFIVVNIDPNNYFLEENENNNVIVVPYTLVNQSGVTPVITASGSTALCAGSSVNLTATPASSYLWSNGATTQSITVTQPGNYTVLTDAATACPATSAPFVITQETVSPSVTPTATDICPGDTTTLTTNVISVPNATVQTQFSSNAVISIPDNSSAGILSQIVVSGISPTTLSAGVVVSVGVNITHPYVGDLLLTLISPNGTSINLSNRRGGNGDNFTGTTFSMFANTPVANGSAPFSGTYNPDGSLNNFTGNANGTWRLKVSDLAANDTGKVNSWSLTLNNVVPVQLTYSWSSNPAGFTSTDQNPEVIPTATTTYTVTVTNSTTGCTEQASATVNMHSLPTLGVSPDVAICEGESTVLTATGAQLYVWTPPTGLNTILGPTVTASPTTTTTYTVTGASIWNCISQASVTVTVNPLPIVSVAAFDSICSNAAALALTGGTPAGGTYSGAGVVNNIFTPSVAGIGTHTIEYMYSDGNGCSGSASSTITVKNCGCTVPKIPSSITGPTQLCSGVSSVYSVVNVPTVTTYTWVLPAGVAFVSGQGTNSVTVVSNNTFTSGVISVYGSNACGDGLPRTKNLQTSYLTVPGSITGEQNGICTLPVNLTAGAISGATSYNWTLPPGSVSITGQGTNSISFSVSPAFVSGQVCVNAINACAVSAPRCVKIYGAPIRPLEITGDNFACATDLKPYSVTPSYGATLYNWTVPAGSSVSSGQGTPSASVTFGATSGFVRCLVSNACGTRGAVALNVNISCREGLFNENFDVEVNPNPASDNAFINISGITDAKVVVTITNVIGKDILKQTIDFVENETIPLDLSGYSKGIYLVTVQSGENRKVTRLVVQ